MPTLVDAMRARVEAERMAAYESTWTLTLSHPQRDMVREDAGVLAMIDLYGALADRPVAEWQRGSDREAGEDMRYIGGPDGRGIRICDGQPDGGSAEDGWPRTLDVRTVGLPSLRIEVTLCSDMAKARSDDAFVSQSLTFVVRSTAARRERVERAIVDRFARLGYAYVKASMTIGTPG